MKKSSASSSNTQNLAFVSSDNTSSINTVNTASGDYGVSTAARTGTTNQVSSTLCTYDVACSFFAQLTTSLQIENEDFQQIGEDDLEELDLRWQVAMLTVRVKKSIQRTGRNMDFKEKRLVSLDMSKIECFNCHRKDHFTRECRFKKNQGRRFNGDNGRSNAPTNESSSQALVAQDGLGGYDWSNDFEIEPVNYALMVISSSSSTSFSNNEVQKCSKQCLESFNTLQKNFDSEKEKHNRARLKIQGYELALESLEARILGHEKNELAWGEKYDARDKTGLGYGTQLNEMSNNSETDRNFLTPRADISFAGLDEYAIRKKIIESKTTDLNTKTSETVGKTNEANTQKPKTVYELVNRDKVIIEDWNSDDENDVSEVQTVSPVKTNEIQTVRTRVDKINQTSQKQGIGFKKIKACFVCKNQKSHEPRIKNVVNTRKRVVKPVWDYSKRVNHQNFSKNLKYPHAKRTFNPSAILTRAGLVNTDRSNVSTAMSISIVRPVYTVRPVSTARPLASKIAQSNNVIRPNHPRFDIVRPKASNSPLKRAVVSKGKVENVLKKGKWVWRPKGNPEYVLQDHAVVDSGCSSHMTGNKAYLLDYEDYNGGFVAFGSDPRGGKIIGKGKIKTANLDFDDVYFVDELKFNLFSVSQMCDKKNSVLFTDTECLILSPSFKLLDESQIVLRAPRQNDVYSLDLKNIVPSGGLTCLYANATTDESKLWHRRLGHVNFKNMNKLVKGNLVRGLPSKVFVNDHTCVACKKGKQHKASCKAKLERTIRKPLELLHMDLFGPVSVHNINKKRYCLVVTDDFSRFSWVFFLGTKDETSEILFTFITGLENQLNHKVKIIRCDHGTEFKNYDMNVLCAKKGIKREYSVARTPQQNGVAERKNRTLIEAARTMLADSLLPIPFWAEAVNTACYVLNRVLV
ncbi:putative ribonuclease H-like domain-containing protein, partial [Tanacetum coccineum]